MTALLRFYGSSKRDHDVEAWLGRPGELHAIARRWFDRIRACGDDVTELMHDGAPTGCVEDAGFAYVNVYKAHVNVGFFLGSFLKDPAGLLQGTGKRMRHVKLRPGESIDEHALERLVRASCQAVRDVLKEEAGA